MAIREQNAVQAELADIAARVAVIKADAQSGRTLTAEEISERQATLQLLDSRLKALRR